MNPVGGGRRVVSATLPAFPWDTIEPAKRRAAAHPDGLVDLSVGTPVDPTPDIVRRALSDASNAHGYPQVWGTPELRRAILDHMSARWGAPELDERSVLPVIGSKELVAWLPTQLGLGPDCLVVIPACAYPTYRVGALLAGARIQEADSPADVEEVPSLIWINSPANPTGRILSVSQMREWVDFARRCGAVLASDECYGEFGWDAEPVSVLDTRVCDGDVTGLLACLSMSKRSNMAGYRAGFVVGDPLIASELLTVRKHSGMMLPAPVAEAMRVALEDPSHVAEQRDRYLNRRRVLKPALERAGFRIDHSEGSLYLWATRGEDCRVTLDALAELGILCSPGDFYVTGSSEHVRIGLTASDERIRVAADRLDATG
ncbi:succinyldiaminopimelate transaminase [Acidipropionibacterium virtanenii]|uniref:Aminotransferase n=1 Tax=Acidipropionibacterium virtanenii TaxID=2057246 RepID=A0A344UVL8_9ACTN|nr:succinyldiaminopimelate transaminase [Acidipropionibacterium virtanenii]AXE39316.1 LL-diaminopimelate aminotransferase [Acidipropionibacterium virtanenii]